MPTDRLSATFAALADPTRRAILARLLAGERSVTELAEPFDMSMPAVSKHLRVLEHAGLLQRRRNGRHQVCVLRERPLIEAGRWIETQTAFWAGSLDSLTGYLSEEQ